MKLYLPIVSVVAALSKRKDKLLLALQISLETQAMRMVIDVDSLTVPEVSGIHPLAYEIRQKLQQPQVQA